MKQKITFGKCSQKEPSVFHDQLNWYIFHNKMIKSAVQIFFKVTWFNKQYLKKAG